MTVSNKDYFILIFNVIIITIIIEDYIPLNFNFYRYIYRL